MRIFERSETRNIDSDVRVPFFKSAERLCNGCLWHYAESYDGHVRVDGGLAYTHEQDRKAEEPEKRTMMITVLSVECFNLSVHERYTLGGALRLCATRTRRGGIQRNRFQRKTAKIGRSESNFAVGL